MSVSVQPIPILSDNYAWYLRDETEGAVAVVDPADAEAVSRFILEQGGRLDLVIITHHHDDHIAGVDAVRARFGAKVVGNARDAARLPALDIAVSPGDTVALGPSRARVIDTPGHTRGHVSYYFEDGKVLLCGDTLFSLGCGRLLEGNAEEMFNSLRAFARLPADTLVCCGHEYTESNARFALAVDPDNLALQARAEAVRRARAEGRPTVPSRLGDELAENPFMRASDVATLADLRARKDSFR
jgi:hydroxyacylglutathione hydrolase